MTRTLIVDTLDLGVSPYTVIDTPDFPEARLTDFGRSAQRAGAKKHAAHYEEPTWQVQVMVAGPTSADTDTLAERIAEVDYAFRAGASVQMDMGAGMASSEIVTAECTGRQDYGDDCYLMFSGTRKPWWATQSYAFSGVADEYGVMQLPDVAGELAAEMSLTVVSPDAWTCLPVGVLPEKPTDYAPMDAYAPATLTMTGSLATISTAPAIDVAANRGAHYTLAKLAHSATSAASVRYQVGSTIGASTAYEAQVTPTTATSTAAFVPLGTVRVPSYDLPSNVSAATMYGAPVIDWNQTQYDGILPGPSDSYTFKVNGDWLYSFAVNVGRAWFPFTASSYTFGLFRRISTGPFETMDMLWSWKGNLSSGIKTFIVDKPITRGETLYLMFGTGFSDLITKASVTIPLRYKSTNVNSDGALYDDSGRTLISTDDIYLVTKVKNVLTFDAKTPVRASCSETDKVATLTSVHRIPLDHGALVVNASGAASTGWTYSPKLNSAYPCDANGAVTGTTLAGSWSPLGRLEPVPNVSNHLITLPGVYLSGTITERSLHCIGPVGVLSLAAVIAEPPPPPEEPPPPVYYVSPTGSNAANGAIDTPWQTLTYAATQVAAGDLVLIRGGTYNERLKLTVDGTSGSHITWKAYPGETVNIQQGVYFNCDYNDVYDITCNPGPASLPTGEDPAGMAAAIGHGVFMFAGDYNTLTRAELVGRGNAFYIPCANFYGAHNTVTDPDFSYCGGIQVLGDGHGVTGKGRYNTFSGGTLHHTYSYLAQIEAHDFLLERCDMHDSFTTANGSCDGIYLDGDDITIQYNRIYRISKQNSYAHADAFQWWNNANRLKINGNVIGSLYNTQRSDNYNASLTPYNGVPYRGDMGHIVFACGSEYTNAGLHNITGAAVSCNDVEITNNVWICAGDFYFINPGTWSNGAIALVSGKCSGWKVNNNTFAGKHGVIRKGSAYFTNWQVANNYFGVSSTFTGAGAGTDEQFTLGSGSVMSNNAYYYGTKYAADSGTGGLLNCTAPGFTNPDLGATTNYGVTADYRLTASSPLINKGSATYAPSTDKDGNSRVGLPDIGAYERQS